MSFKIYYNLFLNNISNRNKYKITFKDGEVSIGIPIAYSKVDLNEPTFSFSVDDDNGKLVTSKRTFSSIKNVEEI